MNATLQVLIISDSASDTAQILSLLQRAGFEVKSGQAASADSLNAALHSQSWDLVIYSSTLAQLDPFSALNLVHASGLDVPFIVLTESFSEEAAENLLRAGAQDVLPKDQLTHLAWAVKREMTRSALRAAEELQHGQRLAELYESELKFRTIFENSAVGYILTGVDGTLLLVNNAFAEFLGYTSEELAYKNFADITYPDDIAATVENIRILFAGEQKIRKSEKRYIHKDGHLVWTALSSVPLCDTQGKPQFLITNVVDISERVQALADLRASEQKFRAIFENSSVGYSLTGADGTVLMANPALASMLGYTGEEMAHINFADVTYPADVAESFENIRRLFANEQKIARYEKRYLHKDGHIVWADISSVLLRDAQGKPLFLITNVIDISERVQALADLRASERKFHAIFEKSTVGYSLTAADGTMLLVNDALANMLGTTSADLTGKNFAEITYPADVALTSEQIRSLFAGEQEIARYEKRHLHKDGHIVWTSVSSVLLRDANEAPLFLITNIVDITGRKLSEAALRETTRRSEDALAIANMAYWEFDVPTAMYTFNERYYRLRRITDAASFQMPAEVFRRKYLHPDSAAQVADIFQRGIDSDDPNFQAQIEIKVLGTNGESFWVNTWFRVEKDAAGRTVTLYGVVQDINEHKLAEEVLQQKIEELERFNNLTVDRELRMIELKKEINTLLKQLGQPEKYRIFG